MFIPYCGSFSWRQEKLPVIAWTVMAWGGTTGSQSSKYEHRHSKYKDFLSRNWYNVTHLTNRNCTVQSLKLENRAYATNWHGWKSKIGNKGQTTTQSCYNILQYLTNTIWSLYWKKYKYTRRRAINYTSEEQVFNFSVLKNLGTKKSVKEIVNRVNLHSLSLWQTSH